MGEVFWRNLAKYEWANALWKMCESIAPTYILTTPSKHPSSWSGKVHWLRDWKGTEFRNYIFTPHKNHVADKDALLIDDKDKNCEDFGAEGGRAIVFPQVWNSEHRNARDPLKHTIRKVAKILK
jgi:5'(3')-deoxyribonucleotidase